MRDQIHQLYKDFDSNTRNFVTYFDGSKRVQRSFHDLHRDMSECMGRFERLRTTMFPEKCVMRIAIIGPLSYPWMVADLSCITGGHYSIAVPEFLPAHEVAELLAEAKPDIVLVDYALKNTFAGIDHPVWYMRCGAAEESRDFQFVEPTIAPLNEVLEEYSLAYTSGTSGKVKAIPIRFHQPENPLPKNIFKRLIFLYHYKRSFWSRKDNKVILFMPFSHLQQRTFVLMALKRNINIVLSDPNQCIKHLITEKPNIMVSVPLIYEILAKHIQQKIEQLTPRKQKVFNFYNRWGINGWNNHSWIKRSFDNYLFTNIRKVYGGRADYFVTGSAPTDPKVIEVFYSVGVKILEGYGQSELDFISMNSPRNFRVGSVGKPMHDVTISDDSEILVKFKEDKHNMELLNVNSDGYVHTGDLGYLDSDGYLFLLGRADETIVMRNGKKVFPSKIEKLLERIVEVDQAFITSSDGDSISAVLTTNGRSSTIAESSLTETINTFNQQQADHERIRQVHVSPEAFSVENGMLTANFKMRRKVIAEKFKNASYTRLS